MFFVVILASVLGVTLFLTTRHRPLASALLPEIHRKKLELRADAWRVPGDTKGFTGFLLDTYEDGTLKSRSAVSNGLLHGISQGWHTNGQQQIEEHFTAGTSHGLRTKWHLNGRMLSRVMVVHGKLHGTFRRWDEQGALAEEIEIKDGQPDGTSRSYFPSGFLKSEVLLRNGQVVRRQSWNDQEYRPAMISKLDRLSARR